MNKTLKVMTSAALLAGVVAPVAVTTVDAAGQGSIKVLDTNTLNKTFTNAHIATVQMTVDKGQRLTSGDNLVVELPDKITITSGVSDVKVLLGSNNTAITVVAKGTAGAPQAADADGYFEIEVSGNEAKLVYKNNQSLTYDLSDNLTINAYVKGTATQNINGEIKANVFASGNSPFPTVKDAVISKTTGGELQLSTRNTHSSNDKFTFDLRINESVVGSVENNAKRELKLKLPSGFKWNEDGNGTAKVLVGGTGSDATYTGKIDDRTLTLTFNTYNTASVKAALLEIEDLGFQVDDETEAKKGDVKVKITGDYDTDVTELIVGKYGDYQTAIEVVEMNELLAGKDDQEVGKIVLKEELPNTWIPGRTILITLPEYARWDQKTTLDEYKIETTDGVAELEVVDFVGSDDRTLKLRVKNHVSGDLNLAQFAENDDDPTVVEITGLNIHLKAGYAGDVKVDIAGSAGVAAQGATIATVINPFQMESSDISDVIIGSPEQTSANLVVKEVVKGAFEDDEFVQITMPQGVKISTKPEVKVTKGDLRIGEVSIVNGVYEDSYIQFKVLSDSTEASEVAINGLGITLDRTVPVGNVDAELEGPAVVDYAIATDFSVKAGATLDEFGKALIKYLDENDLDSYTYAGWEDAVAAEAPVAKTITPAPNDTTLGEAVFTIGSTSYSVAGETKTMDVAPFVEAGRTFLPVRYVAEAVGVTPQNILYDNATATVTILKGDRVAQAKLGSKTLTVNGAAIPMDVAAKTVNGRTVLPVRFVAQALGMDVVWDAASQTATVK